jgi:hypothetical protein
MWTLDKTPKATVGIKPEISSKAHPAHVKKDTGTGRQHNSLQSEIIYEDI